MVESALSVPLLLKLWGGQPSPTPVSWDALNGHVEEVTLKSSDGFLPSLIIKLCANQSQLCLFLNMFIPVVVVIIIM